ncbi:MAG TPA: ABC transporter ATP-binding protein [Acidimicrobiales bacterium]|nr:ABC transporter ATP-binding protein [Acidimicrobiales bacterium]
MITLDAVSKRYGSREVAVDALSLTVPDGELCILIGPSGCGKTTTLRMINRLIEPTGGRILIGDQNVLTMDPVMLRRGIGYVIQQGGLFPHRRIFDNVATVPRLLGWDKERVQDRVVELLDLVGLDPEDYGRRFPHELSGGERQRVGVARALGADPPVLLMDEPFAAVDPVTRQRLQNQFLELQSELNKTIVFVTHDLEEAAKLGDRIAVLSKGGVLEQYDTPAEILGHPATEFVADFVGSDRGVRRLAVVHIAVDDLDHPPVVGPALTMAEARAAAEPGETTGESRWAVVVDEDGVLGGWVPLDPGLDGLVRDRLTRFAVEVPLGSSMRTALAEMLQRDVSWIPVAESGRYLGVLTPDGLHAAMRRSVGGHAVES